MAALPSLLLLPLPPTPVTQDTIFAAYRPTITAVISKLKDLPASTELYVAVPVPRNVHNLLDEPRSAIFRETQHLLAGLYSLICVVCARLGVDVESRLPGSIDARIVLLDKRPAEASSNFQGHLSTGPIVDLPTFALNRRRWEFVFSAQSKEGRELLADYTSIANSNEPRLHGHLEMVDVGSIMVVKDSDELDSARVIEKFEQRHSTVAVGGTFDHIHAGHKLLLTATALLLDPSAEVRRLIIGITGDELLKNKKYAQYLGSWRQRQEDVVKFLMSILLFTSLPIQDSIESEAFDSPVPNGKGIRTILKSSNVTIECVEIQDPFGPTITDETVSGLVVSGETRSGGQAVNEKRLEKGWNELEVLEIDVLDAEDKENGATKTEDFTAKISSTAIRKRLAENTRTSSL